MYTTGIEGGHTSEEATRDGADLLLVQLLYLPCKAPGAQVPEAEAAVEVP